MGIVWNVECVGWRKQMLAEKYAHDLLISSPRIVVRDNQA